MGKMKTGFIDWKTNEEERERPSIKKKEQKECAEFVQVRSKVLGPLEQKMSSIEKEIMDLEKIEWDNQALIRATTSGDGKSIALSISIHTTRKEIDLLFDELDGIAREHAARSKELEEKWNEIVLATQ